MRQYDRRYSRKVKRNVKDRDYGSRIDIWFVIRARSGLCMIARSKRAEQMCEREKQYGQNEMLSNKGSKCLKIRRLVE